MTKATKIAICAILISTAFQLSIFSYSFSHPSVNRIVTGSFFLNMVLYPAVFRYHSRKMESAGANSSELPRN
jgi:hypothetical protein